MAEALAVNAAKDFIESAMRILTTVLSRAAEEFKLVWSFKADLQKLEKRLKMIHLLLRGAAESSYYNHQSAAPNALSLLVNDWVLKVKHVAYDADDLLDELAYEVLKRRLELINQSRLKNKLSCFFRLHNNPIVLHFRMGHKVRHLMESITSIFEDARELGIKPIDVVTGQIRTTVDTVEDIQLQVQRELVAGRGLIGRDQDEANLVELLCHPSDNRSHLSLIAIVGMAGLGKTALSKRVFDTNEVREYFEKRIWICVSHNPEVKGILVKMLELVSGKASQRSSYQAIVQELERNLRGKSYLLVLDDVWDSISNVWESLSSTLLDIGGSKGTLVMVTSRSLQLVTTMVVPGEGQVSTTMKKPVIYQLKGLSFDDSWSLLMQRINHNTELDSNLVTKARRMVAKCAGVPLAIKALGDLLRNKSLEEWKEIEESEIWKTGDKSDILPSLKLSFNYLPSAAVKNCFAYCAIFPEDAPIWRVQLIELWMAQGFLQPNDKMERVGDEYFNILLTNSFFQDEEFDEHGNVTRCKMHDVVRALAMSVSIQECLTVTENIDMTGISADVRHLSLVTEKVLAPEGKEKLRTLVTECWRIQIPNKLFMYARCLRVLSLVDAGLSELPDSIGHLKHLRYLDVSDNYIRKFPTAIRKLYNLQTIRHECTYIENWSLFPKELGKLVNLRQIYTNKFCRMKTLCLALEAEADPARLPWIDHNERWWGGRVSDISHLNNLRGSLAIWHLEHVSSTEEARKASLRSKINIERLDLAWSYNASCHTNSEEVLEELQPHENLKVLSIWYYSGKKLPSWLTEIRALRVPQLHNLVHIKFYYCRNLMQLPTSVVLLPLKVLVVWGCNSLTSFPDLNYSLESLETLKIGRCPVLECLPNLRHLTNLGSLEICNCSKMSSLPQGLSSLPNLKELEIGPLCRELDIFPFPDINCSSPLAKSLQKLCLTGWPRVRNLPYELGYCTQLRKLCIGHFASIETLPDWLQNLTCLEELELQHMINLTCLPSGMVMRSARRSLLFRIRPFHCPRLNSSNISGLAPWFIW